MFVHDIMKNEVQRGPWPSAPEDPPLLRFPSEIVEEILALLSQQSIHRFRSVSKSWSSLLVSVEFHNLGSRPSPPETNVQKLLHQYPKNCPDGAHHGLESFDFRNGQSKNDEGIVVWNPFTGVYRRLPQPEYTSGLAYGFGRDSVGSWKMVEIPSRYLDRINEGGGGLYLNGTLYWEIRSGEKIIAFDMVEETFSDVRAPFLDHSYEHVSMGIFGEYLCMCRRPIRNYSKKIVWMMKEHGNWVPFIQYSESGRFG
ncbi:hypothetical protein Tsubulata_006870 [Turnera subulata]|uniref:F-box domain-containing protein n=1 Tax=Turnera subulata TaxID=218843 RepID=A0A9Q0GAI6_9ROSI|nr:hypothetical protein Tsubulata_006870 [Turnera subulata]